MSLHRVCCCDGTVICDDVCTGCCTGCASSYYSGGISWSGQWSVRRPNIGLVCSGDPNCIGNTEEESQEEWDVSITLTIPPGAITRHTTEGGGCCYQRNGNASIAYTIVYHSEYANYVPNPNVCCEFDNSMSGVLNTTYCHTVTPCCVKNVCRFHHAVQVCGGFIGEFEKIIDNMLAGMTDCDDPKDRVALYLGGATLAWLSTYEPLDQLTFGDFEYLGHCNLCINGCINITTNGNCAGYDTAAAQNALGPFSLYIAAPNLLNPCDQPASILVRSFNQCAVEAGVPTEQQDPICYEQHDNDQLPCCTTDYEPLSLLGPLYT